MAIVEEFRIITRGTLTSSIKKCDKLKLANLIILLKIGCIFHWHQVNEIIKVIRRMRIWLCFNKSTGLGSLTIMIGFLAIMNIHSEKKRVLLNRAPTSTQLHLPLPSSLQQPQQYLNQNIARNWEISPNLGRKIKSCQFWLKISTCSILRCWFRIQT